MKFGLICEGITDHCVIENILCGFFPEYPDLDENINFLQPVLDETDTQQQGFGGWEQVIAYLKSSQFEQAVINHDYLVIQIDTDCCEHPNFGIKSISLAAKNQADFHAEVRAKLIAFINNSTVYAQYAEKIIFCICIHSLECWLVALYETHHSKSTKINECEAALGKLLLRQNYRGKFEKTHRCYDDLSKPLQKQKNLLPLATASYSLKQFLEHLTQIRSANSA